MGAFANWLIPEEFMPHGHCYLWDPFLLRQVVMSNALIGVSYFCIPLALLYFVRKRKDLEFNWIFLMFSAFIFACGTTHFFNIVTIWQPAYRVEAGLMSITAVVSAATLVMLIRLMPKLLTIPSPSTLRNTIEELRQQVSLRIDAENSLRKVNLELDRTVSARTKELTLVNQQLDKAKKVLERNLTEIKNVNQELNQFAYVASHDLKSPLRGIDQLASWIEEDMGDNLSSQAEKHLTLMRTRINRMNRLLDDLLAYARAGQSKGAVVVVNTGEVVAEIFDLMAPDKAINLKIADGMPTVATRKAPLELVFRNLISNAIKHHDKQQAEISVSARPVSNGFEFVVQDNGPGIAPEHQQRIFTIFQTLRPRDDVEGSGMGLALVKKTVESVGGTIAVESDGQQGCIFRFTWPTADETGSLE